MEFKITETNRGNKCLISEDFRYRFHKTLKNGKVSWRCSNKSYKATLKTDGENLMVVETNREHCHESDKRKCERQQLRVSVKRKAAEDVTSRPAKLIRTELQSSDNQSIQTNNLKLLQLAIHREREDENCHPYQSPEMRCMMLLTKWISKQTKKNHLCYTMIEKLG